MKYITRWSLMRSSVPENIQEHSHMVAVLAHALGVIRRDVFHRSCVLLPKQGGVGGAQGLGQQTQQLLRRHVLHLVVGLPDGGAVVLDGGG